MVLLNRDGCPDAIVRGLARIGAESVLPRAGKEKK
jgi:hypothetical protein